MDDITRYLDLTRATGAYRDIEIDILEGVLESLDGGRGTYHLVEESEDDRLVGFALFGRAPQTDFSLEVYWFVVDHEYQRSGAGKRLMRSLEEESLRMFDRAIIRVETSARKELSFQQRFFETCGFMLIGRIVDFYESGDDYLMYAKFLTRLGEEKKADAE